MMPSLHFPAIIPPVKSDVRKEGGTCSASRLIEEASSKGYGIGRNKPGLYRYAFTKDGVHEERLVESDWRGFVKFVRGLPSLREEPLST